MSILRPSGLPQICASVVVPVYNVAEWIEEALTSVTSQTCGANRLEIIVVDSGSTDRSVAIAHRVLTRSEAEFKILRASNDGPSRARNIGWRVAKSEWVQFLDGDDLLHAAKLWLQLAHAVRCAPEVAVIYSEWDRLAQDVQSWRALGECHSPEIGPDVVTDLLRPENFVATGSQLFRKAWLERVGGFDERYWLIEDVDLMLRIAMNGGRFYHAPSRAAVFFYRQRPSGSLSRRKDEFVEGCVRNARMAQRYWRSKGNLTRHQVKVLLDVYCQGASYYAERDRSRFEGLIREIELLSPGFVPEAPRRLKYSSLIFGYRRAQRLAVVCRRLKALRASLRKRARISATVTSDAATSVKGVLSKADFV